MAVAYKLGRAGRTASGILQPQESRQLLTTSENDLEDASI